MTRGGATRSGQQFSLSGAAHPDDRRDDADLVRAASSQAELLPGWTVVIPVKPTARGKSRLAAPGLHRVQLARAIALDTIDAATHACAVVVVTDDADVSAAARSLGARVLSEGGGHGLNAAVARGMDAAGRGHRAAMLGDLPALRPGDLAAALRAAEAYERAVVPDAEATGSTLVTVRAGLEWASAFGAGSFARHRGLGCVPLQAASSLRRDVDTIDQLDAAARLGLGPRTGALRKPPRDT